MKNINVNDNKAITLIVLVITVVVMLILAGVSIGAIVNNNGLISHAKDSTETLKEATVTSEVEKMQVILEKYDFEKIKTYMESLVNQEIITQYNVTKDQNDPENACIISVEDGKYQYKAKKSDTGITVTEQ